MINKRRLINLQTFDTPTNGLPVCFEFAVALAERFLQTSVRLETIRAMHHCNVTSGARYELKKALLQRG